MSRVSAIVLLAAFSLVAQTAFSRDGQSEEGVAWKTISSIAAPEANQAAAADGRFAYAIDNKVVAKYDRESGERVAVSTGPASHLNSGFFYDGKLYCAHSNYPRKPEQSEIKVLDPETMELSTFKDFGSYGGSLTWAVFEKGHWWCNFALYGKDNARTFLVKLDSEWREVARYTYPPELIEQLGNYSLSGGIWLSDRLLVTDHDHRILFELQLPDAGSELKLVARHPAPFTGQGIAVDPTTRGLVGIDRGKKRIIFAGPLELKP